jgi:hypothetical protein
MAQKHLLLIGQFLEAFRFANGPTTTAPLVSYRKGWFELRYPNAYKYNPHIREKDLVLMRDRLLERASHQSDLGETILVPQQNYQGPATF